MKKVAKMKKGKKKDRIMEFFMNGISITMPFSGQKITSGYLKKETKNIGITFKKSWQTRYCILDLQKFEFKYAKNPTQPYTKIPINSVVDVIVEKDPPKRTVDKSLFSLSRKDQSIEGFNLEIKSHLRVYRFQASTKIEQCMWIRAFNVMFELRARIVNNLKSYESTPRKPDGLLSCRTIKEESEVSSHQ